MNENVVVYDCPQCGFSKLVNLSEFDSFHVDVRCRQRNCKGFWMKLRENIVIEQLEMFKKENQSE